MESRPHRKAIVSNHPVSRCGNRVSVRAFVHNKSTPATLVEQDFRRRLAVSTLCAVECRVTDRAVVISLPDRASTSIERSGMGLDLWVFSVRDLLRDMHVVDSENEGGSGT